MAPKTSALEGPPLGAAGAEEVAGAAAAGAALAAGFGALAVKGSLYSSTAALVMTTLSRSITLQRTMTRVSDSFHISVWSVSPGKTESAKRTLMLLKRRGSLPQNALSTCRPT